MQLTIHRGTEEIGGSCVELQTKEARILIDFGLPLLGDEGVHTVKKDILPEYLTELTFGIRFRHLVEEDILPSTLKKIQFWENDDKINEKNKRKFEGYCKKILHKSSSMLRNVEWNKC